MGIIKNSRKEASKETNTNTEDFFDDSMKSKFVSFLVQKDAGEIITTVCDEIKSIEVSVLIRIEFFMWFKFHQFLKF